jgi:OTU domain-containing protein 3
MARKKYFEDEENQGQSCCQEGMTMAKTQFHPNQNGNLLLSKNPLSSLANKQTLHQPNHNQSHHNKKKNVTLDLGAPKNSEESFYAVVQQLSGSGLTIREMPGDGNCLFRALADQLEGHPRNHLDHRRAVVQYMRENRGDFEPFVEDDEPFEKYVQTLAQPGTFAGNDVIVAFARLHNVTVVIHQLNSPAWLIHPSKDEHPSGREVHIAYHNGDHYNSVRKLGDESDGPANIKFSVQGHSGCTKSAINMSGKNSPPHTASPTLVTVPGKTSSTGKDRSNSPGRYDHMLYGLRDEDFWVKDSSDVDRLVEDVMQKTGYQDPSFVRETLIDFNFDMISTVDHIVRMNFFFCQTHERQDPESGVDNQQPNHDSLDMESQSIETKNLSEQVTHLSGNDDGSGKKNSSGSSDDQSETKCLQVVQPSNRDPRSPTTQPEIVNSTQERIEEERTETRIGSEEEEGKRFSAGTD